MTPKKKMKSGIFKKKAALCPKGKSNAKAKAKAIGKNQKATLTKAKLAKLGKLTLDEKVKTNSRRSKHCRGSSHSPQRFLDKR